MAEGVVGAMRKSRKSNFSTDEVDTLLDSVRDHYETLYGKHAKRATNRWVRQRAWMDILRKVNGVSVEKRTLQEVKNKWKKCQYALKEKTGYAFDDGGDDSSWEEVDSMPLQDRLSKVDKSATTSLRSQPLSPTKIKVTRQAIKHPHASKPEPPQKPQPPPSPANEEMCLRWNSHHSNMQTAFPNLLSKEQYVDVTLAAEGKVLKCHRLILSSCSPYFEEILDSIGPHQHPVLFMRDIPFWILKSLCDFMYAGEVHICQNRLEELLSVAELLKIKGLARKSNSEQKEKEKEQKSQPVHANREKKKMVPPPRRIVEEEEHEDLLDPLDLLEPMYEEVAEERRPHNIVKTKFPIQFPPRKPFVRRLRKRKYSDPHEPSPPPVFSFRKGTRSRPNVKVPKYYHTDYTNPPKLLPNNQTDPLMDVGEIKTEPIDVEDNTLPDYVEDNRTNFLETINRTCSMIITNAKPEEFKRIKLSRQPVITNVHTIEETSGGLEVIKINVQQPELENKPPDPGESHLGNNLVESNIDNKTDAQVPAESTLVQINEESATEGATNLLVEVVEEVVNNNMEGGGGETTEGEGVKNSVLDQLEKEAMNVANAINMESQSHTAN